MMFDVFRRKLKVTRTSPGNYDTGLWGDGTQESFDIKASVQGADNEVLQTLPEGYRTKKVYVLYTSTELKTAQVDQATVPDVVTIDDEDYNVIKVTKHTNIKGYATEHYQVVVIESSVDLV
jgi:hypothetical protein